MEAKPEQATNNIAHCLESSPSSRGTIKPRNGVGFDAQIYIAGKQYRKRFKTEQEATRWIEQMQSGKVPTETKRTGNPKLKSIKHAGGTYRPIANGKIDAQIRIAGIPQRKRCKTEQEAVRWIEQTRDGDTPLTIAESAEARRAFKLVAQYGHGKSLIECLRSGLDADITQSITLDRSIDEYLKMVYSSRAEKTYCDYKMHLGNIRKYLGDGTPLGDVTRETVARYASTLLSKPTSHNHFLRAFSAFCNWAIKCGFMVKSPLKSIVKVKQEAPKRLFLSIEQTKLLLKRTLQLHSEIMPYVCISLFAGVRPFETMRLSSENFNLETEYIKLSGNITKSSKGVGRMVKIRSNLKKWLEAYPVAGRVTTLNPTTIAKYLRQIDKFDDAGNRIGLSPDCMRHSFATYAAAESGEPGRTAMEMGHSESVAKIHYIGLVTKTEGTRYFEITPKSLAAEAKVATEKQPPLDQKDGQRDAKLDRMATALVERLELEESLGNTKPINVTKWADAQGLSVDPSIVEYERKAEENGTQDEY